MGRLGAKVAFISGGARGQGAEEARLFVREGASVVIGDLLREDGEALVAELGFAARFVALDVTEEASWIAAIAFTERAFGRLDVLVNNAGILRRNKIEDCTVEEFTRVFAVNQLGVFLGMKSAVRLMKQTGGSIVNISSTAGFRAAADHVACDEARELGPDAAFCDAESSTFCCHGRGRNETSFGIAGYAAPGKINGSSNVIVDLLVRLLGQL